MLKVKKYEDQLTEEHVFIVQSPIAIPDDVEIDRAEAVLKSLVEKAGWGEVDEARCQAKIGIRFGWNRHGEGQQTKNSNRNRACRCILPGSVFVLKDKIEDKIEKLIRGIGSGRKHGFGAVLPHPGIARLAHKPETKDVKIKSKNNAGRKGLDLFNRSKQGGPSPSQITTLISKLEQGVVKALDYLQKQKDERPTKIWNNWRMVFDDLRQIIQGDKEEALKAFRTWQDLVVCNRSKEDNKK